MGATRPDVLLCLLAVSLLVLTVASTPAPVDARAATPASSSSREGAGAPAGRAGAAAVLINEFLPRPGTDWNGDGAVNSGDQWVELFNTNSSAAADVSGFSLDDGPSGSHPYTLPAGTVMLPSGRLVLSGKTTGIELDGDGDMVRLHDRSGSEMDNLSYHSSGTDRSFGRLPDGGGLFIELYPTPGGPNVKDDPPQISNVWRDPQDVHAFENVTVHASVWDDAGISRVVLYFSQNNGSFGNITMGASSGAFAGAIPGRPEGTFGRYYVWAQDSRGQHSSSYPESYTVLDPIPTGLGLEAACDRPAYRPGAPASILGRVDLDTGGAVQDARVSAVLWGGRLLGFTTTNGSGMFNITFTAPADVGNLSITVTAEKGAFKVQVEIPIVILDVPNRPPELSDLSRSPLNATSRDDVIICCTVRDDSAVRAVRLAYRASAGNYTKLAMNLTGADRYICSIPRQPVTATVDYYIEAWDGQLTAFYPPGAPDAPLSYRVLPAPSGSGFLDLLASLNCTESLIGRHFQVSGFVRNESRGAVAGADISLSYEGRPQEGRMNGTTDAQGVFVLDMAAPRTIGNWSLRVDCSYRELSNFTFLLLRVHDVLNITIYLSSTTVPASGALGVQGRVLRSDGTPASGARMTISFVNGTLHWTGEAAADGTYFLNVTLPSRGGRQYLLIAASVSGVNGSATTALEVQDLSGKTPGFGAAMMIAAAASLLLLHGSRRRMAPGYPR